MARVGRPSAASRVWAVARGVLLLGVAWGSWWRLTSLHEKVLAVLAASAYSVLEFSWYANTIELPGGELKIAPGDPRCRKGHTTFEQWWCNVLWTVVLLERYVPAVDALLSAAGLVTLPHAVVVAVRLALFPLNVWLLEVVEGYFLMALLGHNPAWTYTTPDAYFHGNIRLGHAPVWLVLGLLVEAAYRPWVAPLVASWFA